MIAERQPKVGEVWTSPSWPNAYTCYSEQPDIDGDYLWTYPAAESAGDFRYTLKSLDALTPPAPERRVVRGLLVERRPPRNGEPYLTALLALQTAAGDWQDDVHADVIVGVA